MSTLLIIPYVLAVFVGLLMVTLALYKFKGPLTTMVSFCCRNISPRSRESEIPVYAKVIKPDRVHSETGHELEMQGFSNSEGKAEDYTIGSRLEEGWTVLV